MSKINILIRKPIKEDGQKIHLLVEESKVLDLNSEYLYLLQSTHFSSTCSVAIYEDKIIGFVSGYIMPEQNDTLFIWQVAVDSEFRGNDLARRLIMNIVNRDKFDIKNIQTTVSPSNKSSLRVFEKCAKELDTQIKGEKFFEISDFKNSHEEEVLYKIGPFNKKRK